MTQIINTSMLMNNLYYEVPRTFFNNSRYPISNDCKLAYSILRALLPLAYEKGCVDEKSQVYLNLNKRELMSFLNIESVEKMIALFDELTSFNLIYETDQKLYVCIPEGFNEDQDNLKRLLYSEESKEPIEKSVSQSVSVLPVLDDEIILNDILERICINDLKESNRPYLELIEEIELNIKEMFYSSSTRIGKEDKPRTIIRSVLSKLTYFNIEYVFYKYMEQSSVTKIHNAKRYIQSMIYNSAFETQLKVTNDIKNM